MITVLYVDDEPDLLELGKVFLEQNGIFSVTTAESGEGALTLMKEVSFDAIVSDFQMPEMNGITLLREIRAGSDVPFILFTGKGREEVVIDAINSGADFYLQKGGNPSVQFAELGHKITQAVSRHHAEKALRKRLEMIRETSLASTRFIRLKAEELDDAISGLLEVIGTRAGADHCYVAQGSGTPGGTSWTHGWQSSGTPSLQDKRDLSEVMVISITASHIDAFQPLIIPSIASLPSETPYAGRQKAILEKNGIKSFLVLPLSVGTTMIGSLCLDTTRRETDWPDEDIDILQIYSQIIAGALARKSGDRALRESEQLYRTVFESTGTAMMILEEDKTVAFVNREMERISGYSREEIEGKMQWTAFVSPVDMERMKQYHVLRRTSPSEVPKNYEFTFLARNGRCISTYITVEMIPGTKKSIVSLIDISREQAARQEMMDSEEKFRNLSEALNEGIYMIQDNRFTYVNPAFTALFGYSAEELLALPDFSSIFSGEDRQRVIRAAEERLSGIRDSERYTVRVTRKDGTVIPVNVHGSRTRYQGKDAIIGTVTPVADPAV